MRKSTCIAALLRDRYYADRLHRDEGMIKLYSNDEEAQTWKHRCSKSTAYNNFSSCDDIACTRVSITPLMELDAVLYDMIGHKGP